MDFSGDFAHGVASEVHQPVDCGADPRVSRLDHVKVQRALFFGSSGAELLFWRGLPSRLVMSSRLGRLLRSLGSLGDRIITRADSSLGRPSIICDDSRGNPMIIREKDYTDGRKSPVVTWLVRDGNRSCTDGSTLLGGPTRLRRDGNCTYTGGRRGLLGRFRLCRDGDRTCTDGRSSLPDRSRLCRDGDRTDGVVIHRSL